MKTLDLQEVAAFLHMCPAVLAQKAREGLVPGAKPGKCWVFLEDDLVAWLRGLYAGSGQAPLSDCEEGSSCHLSNGILSGGLASPRRTASEYDALLARPTGGKPRSTTTG